MLQTNWHIVTSEFPPAVGGVSGYADMLANALVAAGDEVHVWCPESGGGPDGSERRESTVHVHRVAGRFAIGDLVRLDKHLGEHLPPRQLLVQWVPHGFGARSLNIPFCLWLWTRSIVRGDEIDLVVHEPFLSFHEGSSRQKAAALVHRVMITILLGAARRVWVTIPAWKPMIQPYAVGRALPIAWIPVPTTIPPVADVTSVAETRACVARTGGHVIGHFGTYGSAMMDLLQPVITAILRLRPADVVLLLGRGGEALRRRIGASAPELSSRIHATGVLATRVASITLQACDVMLQPYPDGISSRRTSAMAALAHGIPMVSTAGRLTEPMWAEANAVRIVPAGDVTGLVEAVVSLLDDATARQRLGIAASAFYDANFALGHTVSALRASTATSGAVR